MYWAKTSSHAPYNLASSDLLHASMDDLGAVRGDLTGPDGYGYGPLVAAISRHWDVGEDCVVTSFGTAMANHLAMAALIGPGDEVLIESPGYELLESTARYFGADVRNFHRRFEDNFAVDPEEIRSAATSRTKLIVLTNLHNPSGAFTEESTLAGIGEIASEAGARVLVDEVYLDAVGDRPRRTAFRSGGPFVVTNSLTKVYGLSGLRCGWIFAEPGLARRLWRLADLFYSSPVHVAELLSVRAFERIGELGRRSRAILAANGAALNGFFRSRTDIRSMSHAYGLVSFPGLAGGGVDEFCAELRASFETSVVPGRFFGMPEHFRIGLGGQPEMFAEGLRRIGLALDRRGKG